MLPSSYPFTCGYLRGRRSIGIVSRILVALGAAMPSFAHAAGDMRHVQTLPEGNGIPDQGKAYAILYTSTDGVDGKTPNTVSGAVFYPKGTPPKGGWPVVAWAHGTVGISSSCTPSLNPRTARDATYLSEWLHRGFVVVSSDYQGLGTPGMHPYLNTRVEAFGVLDSVRASLKGLPHLRNKVMIVGQSQGAGAAFSAGGWAPIYAPGLNVVGVVATGVPYPGAQLSKGVQKALPTPDPVMTYLLLFGSSVAALDPNFKASDVFTDAAMPFIPEARQLCVYPLEDVVNKAGVTRANGLKPSGLRVLAKAAAVMQYSTLKLKMPVFIGTGAADIDVSPDQQLALAHDACAAGTAVQAHLYKGLGHSPALLASMPDSLTFTRAVMADKPVPTDCTPEAR